MPPEILAIFYAQMGKMLETGALRIWDAEIKRTAVPDTISGMYNAISTKGNNQCCEFGVLDLESCISGVELYYDAEYLARNSKPIPNHMATDLFGHLQGDEIFGAVVLRRKERDS